MKRSVLITGSTDGLGKYTALRLAKEGHEVYMHGRSEEKLQKAIAEVKRQSGNEAVDGFVADFSDLKAVREMATMIKEKVSKLDVLVNNAGVFYGSPSHNEQGLENRFVVNYFAPFLLTNELQNLMSNSQDARIINLSSAAQATVSYPAMLGHERVSESASYAMSKLALTMWSFALAKEQQAITVIALNPGSLLNTKMAIEAYGTHWSPVDKGGEVLYDLVVSDEHKAMSGKYFDNDQHTYTQAHQDAYNEQGVRRLIDFTKELLSKQ